MDNYSLNSIQKVYDALKNAEAPKFNTQSALKKFKPAIKIALNKGLTHSQILNIINKNLSNNENKFTETQLIEFLNTSTKKVKSKTENT